MKNWTRITILVLVLAGACTANTTKLAPTVRSSADDLIRRFSAAVDSSSGPLDDVVRLPTKELDAIDNTIAKFTTVDGLDPVELQMLEDLRAIRTAITEAQAVQRNVDSALAIANAGSDEAIRIAETRPLKEEFTVDLAQVGEDLVRGQACALLEATATDDFEDIGNPADMAQTFVQAAFDQLLGKWDGGLADALDWAAWGSHLADTADDVASEVLVGGGDAVLYQVPGAVRTRAIEAYARYCGL